MRNPSVSLYRIKKDQVLTVRFIEFHTILRGFLGMLPKANMPSNFFLQSFYTQNRPLKRKKLKKLIFKNFLLMAEKRRSFWPFCLPYMIPLALCKNEMKVQHTFRVFSGMLPKGNMPSNFPYRVSKFKRDPEKEKS